MGFSTEICMRNLFVDNSGNIIPVDFGIMGRLDKHNKKYLAEILYGFIKRDYVKVAEYISRQVLFPRLLLKRNLLKH